MWQPVPQTAKCPCFREQKSLFPPLQSWCFEQGRPMQPFHWKRRARWTRDLFQGCRVGCRRGINQVSRGGEGVPE